jgi:hypothetical protein
MSHNLRTATTAVTPAFDATGVAQARPINYQHQHLSVGYAGHGVHVVGQAVGVRTGRGIVGECSMRRGETVLRPVTRSRSVAATITRRYCSILFGLRLGVLQPT